MLDIFKDKQPLFYEEMKKSIKNDRLSHAYLIETNGYEEIDSLIIELVKEIFFNNVLGVEEQTNISYLIDNNCLDDLIIVEPDTNVIKKEQIQHVIEKFKTSSLNNRPRIYVIKEAEKLNKYAANSMLKFLEEPENNIIAFLITENRYKVLETIRSRCQVFSLVNNIKNEKLELDELIFEIIKCLENNKTKSLAYLPSILDNDMRNNEFWTSTFKIMIDIYENSLRKLEGIVCKPYGEVLDLIINKNKKENIISKISVLFETINNLEYNLNINMMLDGFIIHFTGGD